MENKIVFNRIGYNYIPTRNIDKSIEWYVNNLGLKLIDKFEDRGSLIGVLHYPHKNAIALVLVETSNDNPLKIKRNGKYFPVMAMNCDDIEYTYNLLKSKGVKVDSINTLGNGEARYFYFEDDQGNLLEAAWSVWDPKDEYKKDFNLNED